MDPPKGKRKAPIHIPEQHSNIKPATNQQVITSPAKKLKPTSNPARAPSNSVPKSSAAKPPASARERMMAKLKKKSMCFFLFYFLI